MKKVIIRKPETEASFTDQLSADNIYAFKGCGAGIYKAHKNIGNDTWAFFDLSTSKCHANGGYTSLKDLVEYTLKSRDVFEFKTQREFLQWAASLEKF